MSEIFGTYSYSSSQSFDETRTALGILLKDSENVFKNLNRTEEAKLVRSLNQFSTFFQYDQVTILSVFRIQNIRKRSFMLLLTFNSHHFIIGQRKGVRKVKNVDCEMVGFLEYDADVGHVLIRPEKFVDKVIDLFVPVDIDFNEYPDFSSKYYMISDNEEKVRDNIDRRLLEITSKYDNLYLEIKERFMLVRTLKPVNSSSFKIVENFISEVQDLDTNHHSPKTMND